MLKLAIIIGSTRPGRIGEAVARWVYELAQKRTDATFELVDIQEFNLPLFDEPIPPSQSKYSKVHTRKWAAKIASFDGYVFVTPEYNHTVFKPRGFHEKALGQVFDQVIALGGAFRPLREKRA
jgi:NAD(P)H-dependent FMN reductase